MNKLAIHNVKTHLFVQAQDANRAKEQAIRDGMSNKCIEMWKDTEQLYRTLYDIVEEEFENIDENMHKSKI